MFGVGRPAHSPNGGIAAIVNHDLPGCNGGFNQVGTEDLSILPVAEKAKMMVIQHDCWSRKTDK
jgi:hypothetical protein